MVISRRELLACFAGGTALPALAEPLSDDDQRELDRWTRDAFEGPRIGRLCTIGAVTRGMRFYAPNDPGREEWLVLAWGVPMNPPAGGNENWPTPAGRLCTNLLTGHVRLWGWEDEVIRTR